jgi:hypothetical protein
MGAVAVCPDNISTKAVDKSVDKRSSYPVSQAMKGIRELIAQKINTKNPVKSGDYSFIEVPNFGHYMTKYSNR